MIRIPQALYDNLKIYLQNLEDEQAKSLLSDLENQAKPAYITPNGSRILDYDSGVKYRVD
jgi:hypothetical protein